MATMLETRAFDASPPESRSPLENHPTLLFSWWCTGFALVIILARLWGRAHRLFKEDKIMALSIIPLLIRMALVHVILLYGTNNTVTAGLSSEDVYKRSIGSRLVLAARIFYALFIWTAKLTVSEFLKRLTTSVWTHTYEVVLRGIRIFLVITFFGVIIATLSECQPFNHYWQVTPDPGQQCRTGYTQLLTMAICDIITDILLIGFPVPIVMRSSMPMKRKLSLVVLFALSLILIAVTAYRLPVIIDSNGLQQRRTLWASIEILAAAAVSNALILGSFVRDRGVKRSRKYKDPRKDGSVGEPSINRAMTKQHWGNDCDAGLFRSLGGRLDSVAEEGGLERKFPEALLRTPEPNYITHVHPSTDLNRTMLLTSGSEDSSVSVPGTSFSNLIVARTMTIYKHNHETSPSADVAHDNFGDLHRTSFLDVGRVLSNTEPPTAAPIVSPLTGNDTISTQDFALKSTSGAGSTLMDLGGFLDPPPPQQMQERFYGQAQHLPASPTTQLTGVEPRRTFSTTQSNVHNTSDICFTASRSPQEILASKMQKGRAGPNSSLVNPDDLGEILAQSLECEKILDPGHINHNTTGYNESKDCGSQQSSSKTLARGLLGDFKIAKKTPFQSTVPSPTPGGKRPKPDFKRTVGGDDGGSAELMDAGGLLNRDG